MWALFLFFAGMLLLNSSIQIEVHPNDERVENLISDIFPELPENPVEERPSKRIRDTSNTDGQLKDRTETGKERETNRPKLLPLYPCDSFNSNERLCINIRQLGTTLTVGVIVEGLQNAEINWYRFFTVRGQTVEKSLRFVKLSKGKLPWNINLGGNNNELRISPISETDFGPNFFMAKLEGNARNVQRQNSDLVDPMIFRIEPISDSMGPLYHGEEITINIRSHMLLPAQSIQYEWSRVGPDYELKQNLPSNMELNQDGSALIIKEYQNYEDMILTCVVYSNKNFTLGRRNFILKKTDPTESPALTFITGTNRKRRSVDYFPVQSYRTTKRRLPIYKINTDEIESTDSILDYETQTITFNQEPEFDQISLVNDLPQSTSYSQFKRKQRSLDYFSVQPYWTTKRHFPRYKKNAELEKTDPLLDYETQTITFDQEPEFEEMPMVEDLPKSTSSNQEPEFEEMPMVEDLTKSTSSTQQTSQFPIIKKPKLTFHENTPFPDTFATELEVDDFKKEPSLNGLITQSNSMVELKDDRKKQQNPNVKLFEEKITSEGRKSMMKTEVKPTFDDKESMLIADCNVDADCGINAYCLHTERTQKFCKCSIHYRGNGMFCWWF